MCGHEMSQYLHILQRKQVVIHSLNCTSLINHLFTRRLAAALPSHCQKTTTLRKSMQESVFENRSHLLTSHTMYQFQWGAKARHRSRAIKSHWNRYEYYERMIRSAMWSHYGGYARERSAFSSQHERWSSWKSISFFNRLEFLRNFR